MVNQSNEPSIGTSEPDRKDWGKKGGIALAAVLIVFWALSFVQVATGVDVWHYLWPLLPIALGVGILAERGGWFGPTSGRFAGGEGVRPPGRILIAHRR